MSLHHAESMTAPGHAGDSDHEGARVHPSTGCSWRELLLVLVLAALLWGGYLARTDFHVFPRDDVMQAVVAARQFAAGEGHTSRVATPTMLVFLAEQGRLERPWPNALRSPLPVVLMGSLMGFVSEPTAVALSSGIFFVLAVPLIYLIGCRLAGRWAGGLAAIAFVLAPSGLYLGSTGMTESSTIFALAAIILLLMRPFTWRGALLAGVALGIGYLGRSTMQMWALVMVLYVIWASLDDGWGRAIARAAVFVAPLALAVWWWGGQMEALTGEFGYAAQADISVRRDTGLYPGRSSSSALEHWSPGEFILQHPGVMASKYARIARETWPDFITMGGLTLLVACFLVEFVVVAAGGKPGGVRWLLYGVIGMQLLLVPLASFGHGGVSVNRYLDPLGPAAAAFGAAFAIELLRRHGASMRLALLPLGLIVALMSVPVAMNVAVGPYHQADIAYWQQQVPETFGPEFDRDDVVASTHASAISWATGAWAIEVPVTPDEFLRMNHEFVPVDWVYLQHRGGTNVDRTSAWESVMEGEKRLPGFEMHERLEDGAVILRRGEGG